jgi:Domain of unknown function (DUF1963)
VAWGFDFDHQTRKWGPLGQLIKTDGNPGSRSLFAVFTEDARGVFKLDLGPVFERAKAMGPRTLLAKAASAPAGFEPVTLYRHHKGKLESVKVTSKDLLAARKKTGFAAANELPREALIAMVGVESEAIDLGKAGKGAAPKSRVGGTPSLIAGKAWPKKGKTPMGFLLQLETGTLLNKHAGVAIFCSLEGEATTEDDDNTVVLLKAGDFAKKGATPEGVPELPVRPITFEAAKIEIDETRAQPLAEKDALLGAAFEKLQSAKGMQEVHLAQKRGGVPRFLQGEVTLKNWKFIAQLDFDRIDVSKTWPEAGLAGCLYVFVKNDEKDAIAFWQYT